MSCNDDLLEGSFLIAATGEVKKGAEMDKETLDYSLRGASLALHLVEWLHRVDSREVVTGLANFIPFFVASLPISARRQFREVLSTVLLTVEEERWGAETSYAEFWARTAEIMVQKDTEAK